MKISSISETAWNPIEDSFGILDWNHHEHYACDTAAGQDTMLGESSCGLEEGMSIICVSLGFAHLNTRFT